MVQKTPTDTAYDLNYRYNNYNECSVGAEYNCSGIIIHTFDDDAQIWYPSNSGIERGVVSFSWLRNDINIYRQGDADGSIYGNSNIAGMIFNTTETALINEKEPAIIYCSYGINGETKIRDNYGCAMNPPNETTPNPNPNDYSSCSPLGILTAEQLVDRYYINKEGFYEIGDLDQCSFSGNGSEFSEAMRVGPLLRTLGEFDTSARNNEIVIKEWSSVNIKNIPLNAFYYTTNYKPGEQNALNNVRSLQEEYYNLTGFFIPIIEIDMSIVRNSTPTDYVEPFIYNSEDQAISGSVAN